MQDTGGVTGSAVVNDPSAVRRLTAAIYWGIAARLPAAILISAGPTTPRTTALTRCARRPRSRRPPGRKSLPRCPLPRRPLHRRPQPRRPAQRVARTGGRKYRSPAR